jgi:hypothetical protein
MFEWILVLTLSTGAGGGAAIQTVGGFQTVRECEAAGGMWLTSTHAPTLPTGRDYVCVKRTKAEASDPPKQ